MGDDRFKVFIRHILAIENPLFDVNQQFFRRFMTGVLVHISELTKMISGSRKKMLYGA